MVRLRPDSRRSAFRGAVGTIIGAVIVLIVSLVVQMPSTPPEPGPPPSEPESEPGHASGLPWSSGVASEDPEDFAQWRGRPLDNVTTWPNRETWKHIEQPDRFGTLARIGDHSLVTIGVAMLPEEEQASFTRCSRGAYDEHYRVLGQNLVELGYGDAVIRLGWEANGNWYAWSIGEQVEEYKACFRRQVAALRDTAPDVLIDWNMNKESFLSRSVADAYPGDDVVDIIGVDFYDMYPAYPDQAAWDADYMATHRGGPRGLGTWLAFAKSHGKKLSVPEWGLNNGTGGGTDNAFFMTKMYEFFEANAADLAYETYFNLQDPSFMIRPSGINRKASAAYRQLWSPTVDGTPPPSGR